MVDVSFLINLQQLESVNFHKFFLQSMDLPSKMAKFI